MDCHEAREVFEEHRRRELSPDRAEAVEAHLAGCPACRALWAREKAVAGLVRALPRSAAPPTLARQIRGLGARRRGIVGWLGRPWVAAAVAAIVVAAVLVPWLRRPAERPVDVVEALIQSGVAEHRRILLELEVLPPAVDDPDALFARVRSVADVELPKIFAGSGELRLLIAKPTLLASRKTAAAALRYPTSPITTYFILRGKDLPMLEKGRVQIEQYRPHMREVNGFNVVYWKQQDMAYIMVSGLDREGCQKLYLKMRKAL
jgi:putative zinc finger protein